VPRRPRLLLDPSLRRLAYRCHPDGCPRDRTCCVGLVVEASAREVRVVDSLMDELAAILPRLRRGGVYASCFVEDPPGFTIEPDARDACPFLFRTATHALCAIHRLALQTGRSVAAIKPAACRHWPLTLVPAGRDVRLTVAPHARRIGCVAPRGLLPGHPSVLEAFREEIAEIAHRVNSVTGRGSQPRGRIRR
jgi:hypothetical protein